MSTRPRFRLLRCSDEWSRGFQPCKDQQARRCFDGRQSRRWALSIEVAGGLRKISEAPVVFVIGYTDRDTVARIREAVLGAPVLAKPVLSDRGHRSSAGRRHGHPSSCFKQYARSVGLWAWPPAQLWRPQTPTL